MSGEESADFKFRVAKSNRTTPRPTRESTITRTNKTSICAHSMTMSSASTAELISPLLATKALHPCVYETSTASELLIGVLLVDGIVVLSRVVAAFYDDLHYWVQL